VARGEGRTAGGHDAAVGRRYDESEEANMKVLVTRVSTQKCTFIHVVYTYPHKISIFVQKSPTSPEKSPTSPQESPASPQKSPTSPQKSPTSPQNNLISPLGDVCVYTFYIRVYAC